MCRHVAVQVAEKMDAGEDERPIERCCLSAKDLEPILGPELYQNDLLDQLGRPGIATGLAWTPVGGEPLVIEVSIMAGNGQIRLTGQLGDVMKESASMSLSWIRAHSQELGLPKLAGGEYLHKHDIHIHFPAGGVPKDGPSAGVAITMALLSSFWGVSLRNDIAMTGETSLRGLVLPVGGIKEKVLGALRFGIKRVIIPSKNAKDLREIPEHIKSQLEILLVDSLDQAIQVAFHEMKIPDIDVQMSAAL